MALKQVLPSGLVSVPKGISDSAYLSANVARVDPAGDDSTGTVGDLTKPFKTVQAALSKLSDKGLQSSRCVVIMSSPQNYGEDVTTDLQTLTIIGDGALSLVAFNSITFTNSGSANIFLVAINATLGQVTCNAPAINVDLRCAGSIESNIDNTGGDVLLTGSGSSSPNVNSLTTVSAGNVQIDSFPSQEDQIVVNASGNVVAYHSIIHDVLNAASITLKDSRLKQNTSGVVPAYEDLLLGVTGPSSSIDGHLAVFDGTDGKKIKDGGTPGSGGSYLSANVARVDPSGDDSTGTVGDLTKPFKTVQAAINAFEGHEPPFNVSVIEVGNNNYSEDLTSSISRLMILGNSGGDPFPEPQVFNSLTLTGDAQSIELRGCSGNGDINSDNATVLRVLLSASGGLQGNISNSSGSVIVGSIAGDGCFEGTISAAGDITLYNLNNDNGDFIEIDSPGSNITAYRTRIKKVTANAPASIVLIDSVILQNLSSVIPTLTPQMTNLASYDFSQLSTSDPGDSVSAWRNRGIIQVSGDVLNFIPPTSDPHIVGALWNNMGVPTFSAG